MTSQTDERPTDGLPAVAEQGQLQSEPFVLRDGGFAGDGLQDGIDLDDWANIRAFVREDRTRDNQ